MQVPRENPSERLDTAFVVNWQQKIYSPWEIADYLKYKNSSDGSQSAVANRKRLSRLDSPKQPVSGLLEPTMLFTYVDGDNEHPGYTKKLLSTYGGTEKESYLADAVRAHVPSDNLSNRQSKVRDRISRDRTYKTMHICLATDVNVKTPEQQEKSTEHLLCTIHLYSDGMLEVSPDFSQLLEEPSKGVKPATEQEPVNGMLASHKTAVIALRKGLRLGTYTVRSSSGSEFEYTFENMNGIITPLEIEGQNWYLVFSLRDSIQSSVYVRI